MDQPEPISALARVLMFLCIVVPSSGRNAEYSRMPRRTPGVSDVFNSKNAYIHLKQQQNYTHKHTQIYYIYIHIYI